MPRFMIASFVLVALVRAAPARACSYAGNAPFALLALMAAALRPRRRA